MSLSRRCLMFASTAGLAAIPSLISAKRIPSPTATNADLEPRLLEIMERHDIPGALALVDSPETGLWSAAIGVANLETGEPMTTDMHMRIGSITKTFTATMVLQLVDQEILTLDDTLSNVYPEMEDVPNAANISIRHLLSMQSGLVDPELPDDLGGALFEPGIAYSPSDILMLMEGQATVFAPGEGGMYANINYLLLGMIAEHLTGTPWRDLIRTGILEEAGLANTSLPETSDVPSPSPRGYAFPPHSNESMDVTDANPLVSGSSGSMISTLGDLHSWMSALWEGTLLSPEIQQDRFDFSRATDLQGVSYSLGIGSISGMVGHTGSIDGFNAGMFYLPEADTTVVAMTNAFPTHDGVDPSMLLIEAMLDG